MMEDAFLIYMKWNVVQTDWEWWKILKNFIENMSNFAVSIVPADDLAPFGAKPFACTVVTKFFFHILMG